VNAWGAGAEIAVALASAGVAWRAAARITAAARPDRTSTGRRPQAVPPADLMAAERAATARHAGDVHTRLRPLLLEIAGERLAARGVSIDDARGLVGDQLWAIIRPDRPRPKESFAAELSVADMESILDRLEAI
jgi:hypothetical protein